MKLLGSKSQKVNRKNFTVFLIYLDLDLIFYACERSGLDDEYYDRYCVSRIRDKYKNAKVVGYLKEVYVKEHRFENRIKFLNEKMIK